MGKNAVEPSGSHLWDAQKVTTYGTFCTIRGSLTGGRPESGIRLWEQDWVTSYGDLPDGVHRFPLPLKTGSRVGLWSWQRLLDEGSKLWDAEMVTRYGIGTGASHCQRPDWRMLR